MNYMIHIHKEITLLYCNHFSHDISLYKYNVNNVLTMKWHMENKTSFVAKFKKKSFNDWLVTIVPKTQAK